MASLTLGAPPLSLSSPRISSSHSQIHGHSLSTSLVNSMSFSPISTPSIPPLVYCGRGDRKTAKGKRFNHSFGNARPHNKNNGRGPPRVPVVPAPPKKDRFEDNEVIKIEIDESFTD